MFGRKHKGENTAKEPLDVTCVIDTTPQRRRLSDIVDADLVRFGINLHISSTEPGEDVRKGLSSSRCIASTGKMVAAAATPEVGDHNSVARMVDGGEAAQLVVGAHSKFICR